MQNISRSGCRNGCESCVAKGGIRDGVEARRIKGRVYFRDKIVLNLMDKFHIHDLLSFHLYFAIVINRLKFEIITN